MNRTMAAAIGAGVLVMAGIALLLLSAGETAPLPAPADSAPPAPASPAAVPPPPPEAPVPASPRSTPLQEGMRRTKEAGTIAGRVLRAPGREPVPGVEVRFTAAVGREPPIARTAESGPDGAYRVTGLPAGRVVITSDGNEAASDFRGETTLGAGSVIEGFDIVLFPVGALEGRVTGAKGEPIPALVVKAEDIQNHRSSSAITDLDGTYMFGHLRAAGYSISLVDGRLGIRRGRVEVLEGRTGRVDFPGGASLVGTVTGDDRAPMAGAVIHVEKWSPGLPPVLQCKAVSDAKGGFRMECLEPGPCEVHVEVPGPGGFLSLPFPSEIRTGENRMAIDLGRGEMRGAVAGRIRMPDGSAPRPDAKLTVLLSGSPHGDGRASWGRPNVGADGSFRIGGVPAGTYGLQVTAAGFEFQRWYQEVTLGSGMRREGILVDMVRVPVGRVRFTALIGFGVRVDHPRVRLAPADNRAHLKEETNEPGACTATAQTGTRAFRVWADGVGWALKVLEVKEGENPDVEVVLTPEKPAR